MRKADLLPYASSLAAILAGAASAAALPLTPFRYQEQAQRHCPGDTVVWLDFARANIIRRARNSMAAA